jgi:C4-dicarboxylate transporter
MDLEKLDVGQLLKSFFYAVVPILIFCMIGIAVAAVLMKISKDNRTKKEAEEQARLKALREKQEIERMSPYYQKLREKESYEKDPE